MEMVDAQGIDYEIRNRERMKTFLIILARIYQVVISAPLHFLTGPFSGCRFTPTCSQYFIDAVTANGALRGSWQGIRRVCRCHPWGGQGYDPPPGWEEFVAKHPESAYVGRRKPASTEIHSPKDSKTE